MARLLPRASRASNVVPRTSYLERRASERRASNVVRVPRTSCVCFGARVGVARRPQVKLHASWRPADLIAEVALRRKHKIAIFSKAYELHVLWTEQERLRWSGTAVDPAVRSASSRRAPQRRLQAWCLRGGLCAAPIVDNAPRSRPWTYLFRARANLAVARPTCWACR